MQIKSNMVPLIPESRAGSQTEASLNARSTVLIFVW